MNKRMILFFGLAILATLMLVYFVCIPIYRFKYYYSSNQSVILTRVTRISIFKLTKDVYFTPGIYKKKETPSTYVKPIPASHGEWFENAILHSGGILMTGSLAQTKGLNESFKYYPNAVTDYSIVRYLDSLEKSLQNKKYYVIHSFDD